MKTLLIILLASTICVAQNKLFREFGDIKQVTVSKKIVNQLFFESPVLNNLKENPIKPFSFSKLINVAELNFDNHPVPSKKFNSSDYEIKNVEMKQITSGIISGLSKVSLLFPEGKKLTSSNKIINQEILQLLFSE